VSAEVATVEFSVLLPAEANSLSSLLRAQRPEYMKGFFPFSFDGENIAAILSVASKDRYWAIRSEGRLAGFFMLRGLDEGFLTPSFGIAVAKEFSGHGLATKALQHAIHWCRDNGIREVMLKVAEDNAAALAVYRRAGFVERERCPHTGHLVHVLTVKA
jgi:RimJ/RimL family protein N-acetyltransferase